MKFKDGERRTFNKDMAYMKGSMTDTIEWGYNQSDFISKENL
jgi:hypothetical protein